MAIDAAVIIRASSAGLFVLIAFGIITVSRGRREVVLFGSVYLGFGALLLVNNLARGSDEALILVKAGLAWAAGLLGVAAAFFGIPVTRPRARWAPFAGLGLGAAASLLWFGAGWDTFDRAFALPDTSSGLTILFRIGIGLLQTGVLGFVASSSFQLAANPPADRPSWTRAFFVVASLGVWGSVNFAIVSGGRTPWSLIGTLVFTLGLAVAWMLAANAAKTGLVLKRVSCGWRCR